MLGQFFIMLKEIGDIMFIGLRLNLNPLQIPVEIKNPI